MLGVSLVDRRPRAAARACARRAASGSRTPAAGSRSSCWLVLPWSVCEAVFGHARRWTSRRGSSPGLMIVLGAVWTIVYNADVAPRRRSCGIARTRPPARADPARCRSPTRSRRASAPARRSRCSRSSCSRSSSARPRRARSSTRSTTSTTFGGGFDVRAATAPAAPDRRHARRASRAAPGLRAADFPRSGSQSVLAVDATQLGTPRDARDVRRRGARPRRSSSTRRSASARSPAATRPTRQVWDALATRPGPRRRRQLHRAAPRQLQLRAALPDFRLHRLLRRGRHVRPDPGRRRATRRPGGRGVSP